MPQPAITRAYVEEIITRPKFVYREISNNTRVSRADKRSKDYVAPEEKRIYYEIRFKDMREKPADLRFFARLEQGLSGVRPLPKPGMSLWLLNSRIRGINWNMRHENMLNGVKIAPVREWHEKLWTDIDEDKYIVDINDEVRNTDLRSMIRFACERWNIDIEEKQIQIGGLS
jgi:hypothetical protein